MFEFTEGNECFWPVRLPRVNDEGEVETCEVLIRYRIYTRAELAVQRIDAARDAARHVLEVAAQSGDAEKVEEALQSLQAAYDARLVEVRDRITGWKRITRNDEPIAFSAEVLDRLLENQARFEALRNGLYEASKGARAKN